MKTVRHSLFLLVLYNCAFAQNAPAQQLLEAGKIINPVFCQANPSQSYALYIPQPGNNKALPVICFFDPHANGALPLSKYKTLADEYGFILAGSNTSKNGNDWPVTETIWQQMFNDVQQKVKINTNRVYMCGFSGGAKAAGYLAIRHDFIKGVIANGAGMPDGLAAGDYPFSFTGIAGEGDMNMADLLNFTYSLANTRTRHRMIIFDGKHEWAPEATMALAFAGLQLDAMLQGLAPKSDAFINSYVAESKKRLGAFKASNQWIKAAQECELSVSLLNGLSAEADWFRQQAATIAANKLYQQQQHAQDALLVKEQDAKAVYMQHFADDGMAYWAKTVGSLQTAAAAKTAESGMCQRLLAWLSLAFYSISNQQITGNNNSAARHFVELYKLADPTNSEAWYFSAILHARAQLPQATEKDLLKAASCGFNDKERMEQQPEFKKPHAAINIKAVEAKMGVR